MLELEIDRKRLNYNDNLKFMPFGIFMPFGNSAIWEVTEIKIKRREHKVRETFYQKSQRCLLEYFKKLEEV